jgi:hypothetical protein
MPMFGNVTALEGLHVPGKYRDTIMTHTWSRLAILTSRGNSRTRCAIIREQPRYRGTSLIRKRNLPGPYRMPTLKAL